MILDRRSLIVGGTALLAAPAMATHRDTRIWTFDSLTRIGGHRVRAIGNPRVIRSPLGRAVEFDGVNDAVFIDDHPLAGSPRFTFEALFRPDGGVFEQRWFHLESDESPPVAPGTGTTRILFEIRVVDDRWYLDAFMRGPGYNQALMAPNKTFPVGRWYHVAQSYDGAVYRSYVDGVLQLELPLAFKPQGPGKASVGIRMNRVNPFKGAVRQAGFTRGEALTPDQFVLKRP
ncbi:LamG-like jellyroll fold domain-containing protein [Sphingomonas turrisvirgatae]|uniref:Laminin G n=1 Tax=Sphingomonas turrisvirgatae TaxID=1888892 RepID=A0A1E3LV26_9SPHN|nr:LamG-like jellyroll fold domain-containing protein [Sphingomonas turrisvirgatae]ODP37594.1 laminin G [Sphingomonas turrisvirgatae]